jgi:hypothetical protein
MILMNGKEPAMNVPCILFSLLLMVIAHGCTSIHSDAVRELINKEAQKIDQAQINIDLFEKETLDRIKAIRQALEQLDLSFTKMQIQEAKHSLALSSNRNRTTNENEAHAVAYLIGGLYLSQYEGLHKQVKDQFEEDLCALQEAASRLNDSWKGLGTLHHQIEAYARKSVFASVDPALVATLIGQAPGGSEIIGQALEHSRTVNDALQEVVGSGMLRNRLLERARGLSADIVELLERTKK